MSNAAMCCTGLADTRRGMGHHHLQLPGDDDHWVRGGGGRVGRGGGGGGGLEEGRGMGNDHLQLPRDDDHWVQWEQGRKEVGRGRGGEWGTTTCGHPEMIIRYMGAEEGVGEEVGEQGWGRRRGMGDDHLQLPGDDDHWVLRGREGGRSR